MSWEKDKISNLEKQIRRLRRIDGLKPLAELTRWKNRQIALAEAEIESLTKKMQRMSKWN